MKKCKHCKGEGYILKVFKLYTEKTACFYCRGKGVKYSPYGRDNTNGQTKIKKFENETTK